MSSPVNFLGYQILRIDYQYQDPDESRPIEGKIIDPEMDIRVNKEDENDFMVKLVSQILPDSEEENHNCPVKLIFEVIGFFSIQEDIDEKERDFHIGISAPSILYGVIRTWISQITAHSGMNPIIMPSVQFGELGQDPEQTIEDDEIIGNGNSSD